MDDIPVFRASKKRRIERPKQAPISKDPELVEPNTTLGAKQESDDDQNEVFSLSSLIRSRKPKARHGVQFSKTLSAREIKSTDSSMAVIKATTSEDPLQDMSTRFTTSTGQVVDVDQHMTDYIDLQMANRNQFANSKSYTTHSPGQEPSSEDEYFSDESNNDDNYGDGPKRSGMHQQPTTKAGGTSTSTIPAHNQPYHLAEVSLTNLPSTTSAKSQPRAPRPRKPRIGRDGKPFRPRPRKRANSADQARDRLVEEILAENRLEGTYSTTGIPSSTVTNNQPGSSEASNKPTAGTNEDADERMAAEFQRQFLEHIADRRARQQQHTNSAASTKKSASGVPEGPKLGGSRSARAKMHAALQAEKEKDASAKK